MPAARCSICNLNYEPKPMYATCPVCDQPTTKYRDIDPDPNWKEEVKQRLADEEGSPYIPNIDAKVILPKGYEYLGWYFIPHSALVEAGYSYLEPFQVVRIQNQFFELQGFFWNAGAWWIEPVDPVAEAERFSRFWVNDGERWLGRSGNSR